MDTLRIGWMYPDTLYLHGERGNILALKHFAQELGLRPVVERVSLGTKDFDPMEYDILFYGPGEISSFEAVMEDIAGYKRSLAEYIACGKVMLVTGTTASMFTEKVTRFSPDAEYGIGEVISGLCLIPAESREREYVFGDDLYVNAEFGGYSMELIGSQIQMADISIRENTNYHRFGTVIYGRGNNGEDQAEGIVYNNAIFTNLLGPLLVNNPWLTVLLIRTAAAVGGLKTIEEEPEYNLEIESFRLKKKFIDRKRGVLTEEDEEEEF